MTGDGPTATRHLDQALSPAKRAATLMELMTPAEKVAQLGSAWVFEVADGDRLRPERAADVMEQGIGQITRVCGASTLRAEPAARLINDIQRYLIEHTRLGIPALVHEEICSGLMARGATIFPQAIGVASTWMPELNENMSATIAAQMRAIGARQGLSPVLDVARDPRWGRLEETYGEDAHLVSRMGVAFVCGLQGTDPASAVVATAKHFVGYGLSEGGLNWAPAHIPERSLREVFLRPFEAAVRHGGLQSVMNGYNELDGIPCGANVDLLDNILRRQWGFSGTVVSDYFSVRHLETVHHVATDRVEAAAAALKAGIDVELPTTDCYGQEVLEAAAGGAVDQADIDRAVERVLVQKFELGLFDNPYVDVDAVAATVRPRAATALAREIADRSMVLLKNDGVLPLRSDVGSIAVIGPNADEARHLIGDYAYPAHAESLADLFDSAIDGPGEAMDGEFEPDLNGIDRPEHVVTVLDALSDVVGPDTDVRHAVGCQVMGSDRSGLDEAARAAAECDVAVVVVGDRAGLSLESTSGESRDVASLDLPGVQAELVAAVAATGTPTVVVLVAGRPYGDPELHEAASAVLMAWLPGEAGGPAIADALTGRTNPGGKLPVTYPRSSGHIPIFYGHKTSGGRSNWKGDYVDAPVSPLYPFGHGLSYTDFTVEVVEPVRLTEGAADGPSVELEVCVTNIGDRTGDEVVQVYGSIPVASVTRPLRELVGFLRVTVEPGQSSRVRFEIPLDQLAFFDRNMDLVLEAGDIHFAVGADAAEVIDAGHVSIDARPVVERPLTGPAAVVDPAQR
jgi:beta-glucosidase